MEIAVNVHGTRVVQKMVEVADADEQAEAIVGAIEPLAMDLVRDTKPNPYLNLSPNPSLNPSPSPNPNPNPYPNPDPDPNPSPHPHPHPKPHQVRDMNGNHVVQRMLAVMGKQRASLT